MTHRRQMFHAGLALVLGVSLVGCGSSGSTASEPKAPSSPADAAKSADFGTMKNVCHKATGTNKAGSELGVTADTVKVTTISDANSDLQKGLNQELWDAATVFTQWCNSHGGINGRKIQLIKGDAQVVRYNDVIEQACKSSFALVGGGGALDDGGQKARVGCELVALPGFVASAQARGARLMYPAMATGIEKMTAGGMTYIAEKYGKNEPVAAVYGDFATTQFTSDQRMAAAKATELASQESPVNQPPREQRDSAPNKGDYTYSPLAQKDWQPVAKAIKGSKAKGLLFSGQPADLGKLINALAAEGTPDLKWIFADENMYDQLVIQTARAGLSKGIELYVQSFIYPFEEADRGETSIGMDNFQLLFDHYLPNGKSDAMFAVSGFASWLLFAQAASACGDTLTRKCLIEQIGKIENFDAGGLIAPRNPAASTSPSQCFALLQSTPTGFVRVEDPKSSRLKPTQGLGRGVFNCSQSNIVTFNSGASNLIMSEWIKAANTYAKAPGGK